MRFSSASSVSSRDGNGESSNQLSPRHRKKHKRLDAICEKEYTRNHGDLREDEDDMAGAEDSGIRRSSRVRRAPVLLDVSPPPRKKRRRLGNGGYVVSGGRKNGKSSPVVRVSKDLDTPEGTWKSRLRSRGGNSRFRAKNLRGSSRGKRRIFYGSDGDGDEDEEEEAKVRKYTVVKSKRPGRVKATVGLRSKVKVIDETVEVESQEDNSSDSSSENDIESDDETQSIEKEPSQSEEDEGIRDNTERTEEEEEEEELDLGEKAVEEEEEESDLGEKAAEEEEEESDEESESDVGEKAVEEEESESDTGEKAVEDEESESDAGEKEVEEEEEEEVEEELDLGEKAVEEDGDESDLGEKAVVVEEEELENGADDSMAVDHQTERETEQVEIQNNVKRVELDGEEPQVKDNDGKPENLECLVRDTLGKPRIKKGRRCSLCGGGLDGKPPKPAAQDTGESENELYCGSSGTEDPNYDVWDGFGDEPGWLGRLLGPINDRYGIAGTWVHQHCAVWSPEVYFAGLGCLKNVRAALCRGRALKCSRCGRPGATIGCRVDRCPKTYHLPCARAIGCIFDHRKFLIACTDHRHLFQPQGRKKLARIKKVKAKKMKLELRKHANEASRKDIEAEEKWFENCGEDEEFLKREGKRLHRDLARIAPVYIGGKDSESGKLFEGWESVAGLQGVIQCMKEVVLLPLLYPEFFGNIGLTPPRGVLLHGYPGTGKTLVVRALIGACSRGDKRIAYFARKGADCLGKYVGDAERQLRLLFQVAEKCQPSIIFFDEIDGLAPCRSRRQDQTHSSVVSTLLALMDGLKSRGSVVVIGATNRPDAVDPALRRPGRFDREIYFPLPSLKDRAAILSLHTRSWPKQVNGLLLEWVARKTAGFAGADLQALCTQAAIIGLKRNFPLQEILSAAEKRANNSSGNRLPLPDFAVEERDWLEALSLSPPPCSRREAGVAANDVASSPLPYHLIPCLLKPLVDLLVSLHLDERVSLPAQLSKAARMIKTAVMSSLTKKKLKSDRWWSFLDYCIREGNVTKDIERGLLDSGILSGDDCISASNEFSELDDRNSNAEFIPYAKWNGTNMLQPRIAPGFRLLISGNPRSGQRHLASCLVHCFVGNGEVKKVDLATISQKGHGDVVQGITDILMECAGVSSSMIFMPRIDLWAVETKTKQVAEETDAVSTDPQCSEKRQSGLRHNHAAKNEHTSVLDKQKTADKDGDQVSSLRATSAWSLFLEQLETICVSTSLTILATSEVPCEVLPTQVGEFFMKRMLKSQPSSVEHSTPRFVVEMDGDFDHDSVIDISATKLSRDVVQQLAQLLHQRSHIHRTLPKKYIEENTSIINPETDRDDDRHEVRTGCGEASVQNSLPSARISKGRSNLHLAISSFGYQILRYPHFAELCWVTSKLNDGPSAEVTGPWKGWPFNSCIVRSRDSLEQIIVGSRSVNVKTKEKSGLVRGLIAVGLSAYKGAYSSLREVSFEVRKVLEHLVSQVNERVKSGKNRYQYVRLLSQVAFLEDKVNSWAYSLQSLELDASVTVENARISGNSDPKNLIPNGEGKLNKSEVLHQGNQQELGDQNIACLDLNKEAGDLSHFNSECGVPTTDGSQQKVLSADDAASEPELANTSKLDKRSADNILKKQNARHPKPDNNMAHSNGFASGEIFDNGPSSANIRVSSPIIDVLGKKVNESSSEATKHEDVCLYSCCAECLNTLIELTKKALVRRCNMESKSWTVDDVHDIVASLSVDLVSAIRKYYFGKKIDSPVDQKPRTCCCDDFQNGDIAPIDCRCHSKSLNETNTKVGDELKFLFRDGVLVRFDPGIEVSFHCGLEKLCLCSVIDSIQPLN